jgi:hypothetical protein
MAPMRASFDRLRSGLSQVTNDKNEFKVSRTREPSTCCRSGNPSSFMLRFLKVLIPTCDESKRHRRSLRKATNVLR